MTGHVNISARDAIKRVLATELRDSPLTLLLGETVRGAGAAGVVDGLYEEFGSRQVIETPVAENAMFGAALGLALAGMRPIVEIYSADFLLAVANEVINDIAKWRAQHTQPSSLPITIRGCMGANGGLGPEHSQSMEPYLHHAPGLIIVVPGTPADAAGLTRAAIRSDDPVIVLEHRLVYDLVEPVPTDPHFTVPLGVAEVARAGDDLTVVAWGWMREEALTAAETLENEGISAEVIDPRTIRPMDWVTILASARRTRRVLVVEEAPITGGVGAEIVARAVEGIQPPPAVARVAMPDAIHPYSSKMEAQILPVAADIVRGARRLCEM